MRHARSDYDRIQDPSGKIPMEEPVFIIRGQDPAGPATLRYWAMRNEKAHGDSALTAAANAHARRMENWQANMGKVPHPANLPKGATAIT